MTSASATTRLEDDATTTTTIVIAAAMTTTLYPDENAIGRGGIRYEWQWLEDATGS